MKINGHSAVARGFTLIELLVVIAIIGVLSSVVLASLNTARSRGNDAAVKSNMATIAVQAELEYDTNGDYDTVCGANSQTQSTTIAQAVAAADTASSGTPVCGKPASGAATAWAVSTALSSGNWCVDSTGFKGSAVLSGATDVACN